MFKTKAVSVLVLFLTLSLATGCSLFNKEPSKSPEDMMKSAVINSQNIKTSTIKLTMDGSVSGDSNGTQEQVAFNVNVDEKVDVNDAKSPKLDLDLVGDVTIGGNKYDGEVGFRLINRKAYFNILKYPDTQKFPDLAMIATFAQKWFFISMDELGQTIPLMTFDESSMTPEMKQIREEAQNTNFFKGLKYEGREDVSGTNAYKYTGTLDTDKVYEFLVKIAEINKTPSTDDEKAQMKKALSNLNLPLTVWISSDDEVVVQVAGVMNYYDTENKVSLKANFNSSVLGINKAVVIEEPKDAVDLKQVISSMMGAGAATGDTGKLAPTK